MSKITLATAALVLMSGLMTSAARAAECTEARAEAIAPAAGIALESLNRSPRLLTVLGAVLIDQSAEEYEVLVAIRANEPQSLGYYVRVRRSDCHVVGVRNSAVDVD